MRAGSRRADVPYRWPTTMQLPKRPPQLVYLDLNHWVSLAKAASGHPQGARHREILAWSIEATEEGLAQFPISDTIYMEISKIGAHRQRRDLRQIIERLSGFTVVISRVAIATHEAEAILDEVLGPSSHPINNMDYLDWGVARAFGMVGGFRIKDAEGRDVTEEVRAGHAAGPEAFDAVLADASWELNRRTLEGPTRAEEPALRELGWSPDGAVAIADQRARQEVEQVTRFDDDPAWRRGRIRDVVAAREILVELNDLIVQGLADRDAEWADLIPNGEARRWMDSMPSFDVSVTLKTSHHRNPSHHWTANDIHDIDALASTLPYCDVVVTDRAMCSHVTRTGLAERLGTTALSSLAELPDHV